MKNTRLAAGALLAACGILLAGCSGSGQELGKAVEDLKDKGDELVDGQTGGSSSSGNSNGGANVHTVTRIVDGDTIEVSPAAAGGVEEVRFLAVDTPETYGGNQPLGPEASAFTTRKLEGERVKLEYDQEKMDPYDRALAHVTVVGQERSIQEQLLARGLALMWTIDCRDCINLPFAAK